MYDKKMAPMKPAAKKPPAKSKMPSKTPAKKGM